MSALYGESWRAVPLEAQAAAQVAKEDEQKTQSFLVMSLRWVFPSSGPRVVVTVMWLHKLLMRGSRACLDLRAERKECRGKHGVDNGALWIACELSNTKL